MSFDSAVEEIARDIRDRDFISRVEKMRLAEILDEMSGMQMQFRNEEEKWRHTVLMSTLYGRLA